MPILFRLLYIIVYWQINGIKLGYIKL
jgi:hypothetical protein